MRTIKFRPKQCPTCVGFEEYREDEGAGGPYHGPYCIERLLGADIVDYRLGPEATKSRCPYYEEVEDEDIG